MTEKRHYPSVISGPVILLVILTTDHCGVVSVLHRKSLYHASSELKVLIFSWLWESGDGFGILYIF